MVSDALWRADGQLSQTVIETCHAPASPSRDNRKKRQSACCDSLPTQVVFQELDDFALLVAWKLAGLIEDLP